MNGSPQYGCIAAAVLVLAAAPPAAGQAWEPPIGIPAPPFGINEQAGPFTHYVDNTHPAATDTSNPNGSPSKPRLTIPGTLAAGSVVEVHGGPYTLAADTWRGNGTPSAPVFIKGVGGPRFPGDEVKLEGSYFVVEGLVFDGVQVRLTNDPTKLSFRLNEVKNYSPGGNSTALSPGGSDTVIYGNHIHHNGDAASPLEIDIHGIKLGSGDLRVWVVDNHIHENGGDSIQVGNAQESEPWARFIYIGRNDMHDDRENAVDIKKARDVVISQNKTHGYVPSPSGSDDGTAVVIHDNPARVWVLFNEVYDSTNGIRCTGAQDGYYVIGNVIRDIKHLPGRPYDPGSLFGTQAIHARATPDFFAINNTIYDVDAGISYPTGSHAEIINNVVGGLVQDSHHVAVGSGDAGNVLKNNVFDAAALIRFGGGGDMLDGCADAESTYPGQIQNCINADPALVDPIDLDFHLLPGSPAVDAGIDHLAYDRFVQLYGIDIRKDRDGRPRPIGLAFEIGAYEAGQFVTLEFQQPFGAAAEDAGSHSMTVELSTSDGDPTTDPVTVQYSTTSGTALAGSDYAATTGVLSFPSGTATGSTDTLNVSILDDPSDEANEAFTVRLSNPIFSFLTGQRTHTVTITDDDPPPTVSITDVTVTEGNSGKTNVVLTVSLSVPSGLTVTVPYFTANGTATAPSDYTNTSGSLVFAPGTPGLTISVPVVGDTVAELAEDFVVNLNTPTNATLADSQATVTILNNDLPGSVQFGGASYTVSEVAGKATLTLKRTGGFASGVTVDFETSNGTATAGADYAASSGTLTFGLNVTTVSFSVPITNDTLIEGSETLFLRLQSPTVGATLGLQDTAVVTIADNEAGGAFRFGAAAYSRSEVYASASVAVARTGGVGGPVTVVFATSNGTAVAGSDYTATSGTLTFGIGQVSQTVVIPLAKDALDETNETFNVALSNATGGASLGTPTTTAVTITDNDAGGVVQFSLGTYSVDESAGPALLTVSRTGGVAENVTVSYTTSNGSASAPSDYTSTSGVLSFASGQLSQTISVPVVNDSAANEGGESLSVTLSSPSGGATLGSKSTATVTIVDNEPGVTLHFATIAQGVTEGGSAVVTVLRSGPTTAQAMANFATSDGTATLAGGDYTGTSGTLTFLVGQTSKTFAVKTTGDTVDETNETLNVSLSSPSGGGLGTQQALLLTVVDNDAGGVLKFSKAAFSVNESSALATISVTRSGGLASGVTVGFATSNGTAVSGTDYTATSGTLTFLAGQASRTFTVPIVPDSLNEASKTLNLSISAPTGGATLGTPTAATLTIVDNDPGGAIQFKVAAYSASESSGTALITLTRSGTAGAVTVDFATSNGTAASGADYAQTSGTLTFGAGQTSQTIAVMLLPDGLSEGHETVNLSIGNATGGATLGARTTAVLTIVDDEAGPTLHFGAPIYTVAEGATATISVIRTGTTTAQSMVTYATSPGTALVGTDYTPTSGVLTFSAGQTTKSFTVKTTADTLDDPPDKQLNVTLSSPSGASLGTQSSAVITLLDNDAGGAFKFSAATYSRAESYPTATITVARTGGVASGVTVQFATSDGTAQSGSDYTLTSGTLTFAAGQTSRSFTVPIVLDTLDEVNETVNLSLTSPTGGATLGALPTALLTITDNDVAGSLKFSLSSYSVGESASQAVITVLRSGGSASAVTVSYATSNGSASGSDYTTSNGTLTFGASETTKTFMVPIAPDGASEANETVLLTLSNPGGGGVLGTPATATLYIIDDE